MNRLSVNQTIRTNMCVLLQTFIIINFSSICLANVCGKGEVSSVYNHGCISVMDCLERKLVIYDDTCIHNCPNEAPNMVEQTRRCVEECPMHTVINRTDCLDSTHCTREDKVVSNNKCVNACLHDELFKKSGVCYTVCPSDTLTKGTECIPLYECTNPFKVYNGTCTSECPEDAPFKSTCFIHANITSDGCPECSECPVEFDSFEICTSDCPVNTYVNGSRCEIHSNCMGKGMFIFNSTCVNSCPLEAALTLRGYCMSQCPSNTFVHNSNCIDINDCTKLYKVIHNDSCIQSCPSSAPYIYEGKCLPKCPFFTLIYNSFCATWDWCKYTKRYYVYDRKCIQSCPNTTLLVSDQTCWSPCPPYTVRYMDSCITKDECNRKGYYVYSRNCTPSCPSLAPIIYDGSCFSMCPRNTLTNTNSCITPRACFEKRYHRYNGRCIQSCPRGTSLTVSSTYYWRYVTKTCYDRCPNNTQCTCNGVVHNDVCLPTCPENHFSLSKEGAMRCVDTCPIYYVPVGPDCKPKIICKLAGNVVFNHTCISKCPLNTFNMTGECLSECPNNTFVRDSICEHESKCTSRLVYNRSCVDSCPKEYKYNASGVCSAQCLKGTYSVNLQCHNDSECQRNGMFMFQRKCIPKCPSNAMYQYKGYCVSECPQDSLQLGIFCKFPKKECGLFSSLFDGKKCLDEYDCRKQNKYVYKGGCIDKCTDEYFSFGNSCVHLPNMSLTFIIICILFIFCLAVVCLLIYKSRKAWCQRKSETQKNTKGAYINPCFDGAELNEDDVPMPRGNESIDPSGLQLCDINTVADVETEDSFTTVPMANLSTDKTDYDVASCSTV